MCIRDRIYRKIISEAMLPIAAEAEEVKVKLLGLGFVKDTYDGDSSGYMHGSSLMCVRMPIMADSA